MNQVKKDALTEMDAQIRSDYDDQIKQQVESVISLTQEIYDQCKAGAYTLEEAKKLADEAKKLAEEEKQKAEEEKRKAEEAESRAGKAIERNYRLIVNILSGRTYEEAADMLGISIEDVKEAEAAIKAIDK